MTSVRNSGFKKHSWLLAPCKQQSNYLATETFAYISLEIKQIVGHYLSFRKPKNSIFKSTGRSTPDFLVTENEGKNPETS